MSAVENTNKLRELFTTLSNQANFRGVLGVTDYKPVYDALMPVQKPRLIQIVGDNQNEFMEHLLSMV